MPTAGWSLADAPAQTGRLAIVTGASGGLGFAAALGLARCGAEVILAGRSAAKGEAALSRITRLAPGAKVGFASLDLARLDSVAAFVRPLLDGGRAVDILVNNAGVMALPRRETTPDGFEKQFGVNYLGHFALTARLMPALLRAARPARIVALASLAHREGRIAFDDLQGARHYDPWTAYRQSKLAMLMFGLELAARAGAAGWPIESLAAHPGWAVTDIITNGPGEGRRTVKSAAMNLVFRLMGQSAEAGALPVLYAATAPEAVAGGYYGPVGGAREIKGPVGVAKIMPQALDAEARARLWAVSEDLVGVRFGR
jgi:NAD(P)-dependent dehydrogenase (short-subunit alcohol dehydrogenase family)